MLRSRGDQHGGEDEAHDAAQVKRHEEREH
jgi:hypothetical protein